NGIISQMPINRITLMSSGRSSVIRCGGWGTIEFIHTTKQAAELQAELAYDRRCHLWRASVSLALKDMKSARRSLDLIDRSLVNESI
ncbi:MAG: type IV toxin-antitoxin system AbiEi family antitoxin, partial [Desulfuromonadales bacterium]